MDNVPIRNAATIVLVRDAKGTPSVLMGQRGAKAVFMPSKFVFPGGALDDGDLNIPLAGAPDALCDERLIEGVDPKIARALPAAAIRELWEETGLTLGTAGTWNDAPEDWAGFANAGFLPDASALRFFFRAITPVGRPRRFDARFFLAPAEMVQGDLDDFSHASDELSGLQWIPLDEVRSFDLPFITEVVLAELTAQLPDLVAPKSVPFFKNNDEESLFLRLGGRAL